MKNNTQQSVRAFGWFRRNRRFVIAVLVLLVLAGTVATNIANAALPTSVFNQVRDGSVYGGRSPNPGSMLLYRSNNGNFWGGSMANPNVPTNAPNPNNSTGTGFKHVLKNQDSGQIRTIKLRAYYNSDAEARAAVYGVQSGICNFDNGMGANPRKLMIVMNSDVVSAGPQIKFDKWAVRNSVPNANIPPNSTTPNNNQRVCPAFNNFEFSLGGAPAPFYDVGSNRFYNTITFILSGDDVNVAGNKNQVRFQLRHMSGAGIMGMAATAGARQFGLVEGGADSEAPAGQRYSVTSGIRFGKSCVDNLNNGGVISVYDADAGKFGNSSIYVMRRPSNAPGTPWVRLGQGGTETMWLAGPASWSSSENRWDIFGVNNATASIVLNDFKNTYDYMLVYDNPDSGSTLSPTGNIISLGIPGDTIYGESNTNCSYNLTPFISGLSPASFTGNYNYSVTGSVSNSETDTIWADKTSPWRITKAIFSSNPADRSASGLTTDNNCTWIQSRGGGSCTEIAPGDGGNSISMPTINSRTVNNDSGTNVPVGSYVCYFTSVKAAEYLSTTPSNWDQLWRHSGMTCAVSVKNPSLGVDYGDVRTGGSFDSCSTNIAAVSDKARHYGITMTNYGAGAQHSYVNGAALSVGTISNFASLSAGPGTGTASMRGHFARAPSLSGLFYGDIDDPAAPTSFPTHCLSPVFARQNTPSVPQTPPPGNATITGVNDQTTTYTYDLGAGGTLNLGAFDVPVRQRIVVRATGSGTIILNGDIRYFGGGTANTISQLAQFTLLADGAINIVVADAVTRLDGIYAGRGDFYTCQTYRNTGVLTSGQCNIQLKINGSVIVEGRLYPHRTAGHTIPTDTTPAEVFTLRPDILLSDYADSGATPGLKITSQRELAPRY